jgi:thiamine pyrophosphokinase
MSDANTSLHTTATDAAMSTVVVFAGGEPVVGLDATVFDDAYTIAADSGVLLAGALGCDVDLLVGDLDSAGADAIRAAEAAGARVERFPVDKDETDLEIALDRALATNPDRVIVVGGHGGRLDHFLANALLLASEKYASVRVCAYMGDGQVHVVRDRLELRGEPGALVTLLAVHGPAREVVTDGLRYPLHGETLAPGSTRGVSNELVDVDAAVGLSDGVLLVVAPWRSERGA